MGGWDAAGEMARGFKVNVPLEGRFGPVWPCVGGGPRGPKYLHTQSVQQRQAPGLARDPQRLRGLCLHPSVECGL